MNLAEERAGSSSDESDNLLDLEEGVFGTPLVDQSRQLTFATSREPTSPELEDKTSLHHGFGNDTSRRLPQLEIT